MISLKSILSRFRRPKPPTWYTAEELRHYLVREKYSDEIANELSVAYAKNLQLSFNKGYSMGRRSKP